MFQAYHDDGTFVGSFNSLHEASNAVDTHEWNHDVGSLDDYYIKDPKGRKLRFNHDEVEFTL